MLKHGSMSDDDDLTAQQVQALALTSIAHSLHAIATHYTHKAQGVARIDEPMSEARDLLDAIREMYRSKD
jgi:phosphoenolpyruvate carboxylase